MPKDFARGHPKRAHSLPFSERGLGDRLSSVLPAGTPVILASATPQQEEAALVQLADGPFRLMGLIEGCREA